MDSDEAFDLFIEEDEAQSDKENKSTEVNPGQPKTTKEQYNKIIAFVKDYNEELVEKEVYDKLWNKLTDDLNVIGPPSRSSEKWKRTWSEYKYRRQKAIKRKRSDNESQSLDEILESTSPDLASHSSRHASIADDKKSFHSDVLRKFDTLINLVSEKLDLSNNLLQEISKKL